MAIAFLDPVFKLQICRFELPTWALWFKHLVHNLSIHLMRTSCTGVIVVTAVSNGFVNTDAEGGKGHEQAQVTGGEGGGAEQAFSRSV